MSSLSTRESNLLRLWWVNTTLAPIIKKFPELQVKDGWDLMFRTILRQDIIVQLHNFIKIRGDLIKDHDIKRIDRLLEPLWNPIMQFKRPIKLLRDNYIAHIQEGSRGFRLPATKIVNQYHFPTKFGDLLFMSGCVRGYSKQIEINFKNDWFSAIQKYEAASGREGHYGHTKIDGYEKKLKKTLDKVSINLQRNNLSFSHDVLGASATKSKP